MNKDEFIKVVNAMIDSRIKKIVPALIKKEMAKIKEEFDNGTTSLSDDIEIPNFSSIIQEDSLIPKNKPSHSVKSKPITKVFSKDPILNSILQQTAEEKRSGKIPEISDNDSLSQYKQLLTEQYARAAESGEDMQTFNFDSSNLSSIATGRTTPRVVNSEVAKKVELEINKQQLAAMAGGNEELAGTIIRDYRSLLKKTEEKVKANRGA